MAKRESCSYNTNIKCDSTYELSEFYRQMKRAHESGKQEFFAYGTDMCPCMRDWCPRYQAAQQKQR